LSERESEHAGTGRAGKHGRILDWTEAGLWVVLLVVGSLVAMAVLRDNEVRNRTKADAKPAPGGLVEAEDLPVIGKSRDFTFWLQPSSGFPGGNWSKDGHMFASQTKEGDWIDLRLPELESGHYELELFMTKAADYGIVAVYVNEVPVGEFDLLSLRARPQERAPAAGRGEKSERSGTVLPVRNRRHPDRESRSSGEW